MLAQEGRPAMKAFAQTSANALSDALAFHGLREILDNNLLQAWFQQIIDLQSGDIIGYEGLIRGPADSPYHAPARLFSEAERLGLIDETEAKARFAVIRRFAELQLPGKMFLIDPAQIIHEL